MCCVLHLGKMFSQGVSPLIYWLISPELPLTVCFSSIFETCVVGLLFGPYIKLAVVVILLYFLCTVQPLCLFGCSYRWFTPINFFYLTVLGQMICYIFQAFPITLVVTLRMLQIILLHSRLGYFIYFIVGSQTPKREAGNWLFAFRHSFAVFTF